MTQGSSAASWTPALTGRKGSVRLLAALGLVLPVVGAFLSWLSSTRYGNDYVSVYVVGRGLLEKNPIYDREWQPAAFGRLGIGPPNGLFYPPATGVVTMPLALLPYAVAHALWLTIMIGTVLYGVRSVVRLLKPDAPSYEWRIAAGLVLASACVRWGMTPGQGAPLIMGVLCLFVVALHEGPSWLVFFLATFATAFKPTLALPFLGLLVLHRHYKTLVAAIAFWITCNLAGFIRLGGLTAFHAYQHNISGLEAIDDINTPDPWRLISVPRLDWIYLFDGITRQLAVARLLTLVFAAATGAFLIWQMRRFRAPVAVETTAAFLGVLVCLANSVVYHHHYDISLIVAPALVWYFGAKRLREPRWANYLMLPLLLMAAFWPVAMMQHLVLRFLGPIGWGLMDLLFPLSVTAAMAGALAVAYSMRADPRTVSLAAVRG
jgi:hypothetical protein